MVINLERNTSLFGPIQYQPIDSELKKKIETQEMIHELSISLMLREVNPEKLKTAFD